ncbi:hypothetical protein PTTG_28399 [Puccinia triticina 1-1 BBBD Race 1]|uniref:Uncharacterized protein n=1 Tax=Puccinia triticina (isolate 1-1 / race 1 (BBBD)) TaxID=630390 RepID=A0A180GBZ4_PUCT1|nr:hypothetical protein PTTG_28399 [Puccinia triticina 1-1 BBBD Race 1]
MVEGQDYSQISAMGFSAVQAIPLSWVGVAWAWNLIWFLPVDLIKFATRAVLKKYQSRQVKPAVAKLTLTARQSTTGSLYNNRMSFIQRAKQLQNLQRSVLGQVCTNEHNLRRFSSAQVVSVVTPYWVTVRAHLDPLD